MREREKRKKLIQVTRKEERAGECEKRERERKENERGTVNEAGSSSEVQQ